MKFRKNILLISMLIILSLSVNGCNFNKSNSSETSGETKEKMTITWLGIPYNPSAKEGTFPEKLLEEKFNVEIKPIFLDAEGFRTKKPLLFSSGQIADVIYLLDPVQVQADVNQGFLAELPYETIKKYAPTVYNYINDTVPEAWLYSYTEGKNYGIPNWIDIGENHKLGLWRLDWLYNVGIEKVPETIDEMHNALLKFVNEDPDKNNKKDTYGLSGDIGAHWMTFTEVFGAYGVIPFNWMMKDGKVVYGGILPETKEALRTLATWYKEGIIHPDFITDKSSTTIKDKFTNGNIGYMNHFGYYGFDNESISTSQISIMKKLNPNVKLAIATPPKGPSGKSGTHAWGKGGHIISFGRQLKDQPKKVAKVLEIIEYIMNDEEFALKLRVGEKGIHWDYNDAALGSKSGIKQLPPYDDRRQSDNECFRVHLGAPSFFALLSASQELGNKYVSHEALEFNEKYYSKPLGLVDVFLKADTLPSASGLLGDLNNMQLTVFGQIIRGEKDINYFDEFINIWKTRGGEQLINEANEQLKTRQEIYKKVGVK